MATNRQVLSNRRELEHFIEQVNWQGGRVIDVQYMQDPLGYGESLCQVIYNIPDLWQREGLYNPYNGRWEADGREADNSYARDAYREHNTMVESSCLPDLSELQKIIDDKSIPKKPVHYADKTNGMRKVFIMDDILLDEG